MDLCSLNKMLFLRNFLSLAHKHTCMQNVPTNNDLLYSFPFSMNAGANYSQNKIRKAHKIA